MSTYTHTQAMEMATRWETNFRALLEDKAQFKKTVPKIYESLVRCSAGSHATVSSRLPQPLRLIDTVSKVFANGRQTENGEVVLAPDFDLLVKYKESYDRKRDKGPLELGRSWWAKDKKVREAKEAKDAVDADRRGGKVLGDKDAAPRMGATKGAGPEKKKSKVVDAAGSTGEKGNRGKPTKKARVVSAPTVGDTSSEHDGPHGDDSQSKIDDYSTDGFSDSKDEDGEQIEGSGEDEEMSDVDDEEVRAAEAQAEEALRAVQEAKKKLQATKAKKERVRAAAKAKEEEERALKAERERLEKEEQERAAKAERLCLAKEERERVAKERERVAKEERERVAKENRDRAEKDEKGKAKKVSDTKGKAAVKAATAEKDIAKTTKAAAGKAKVGSSKKEPPEAADEDSSEGDTDGDGSQPEDDTNTPTERRTTRRRKPTPKAKPLDSARARSAAAKLDAIVKAVPPPDMDHFKAVETPCWRCHTHQLECVVPIQAKPGGARGVACYYCKKAKSRCDGNQAGNSGFDLKTPLGDLIERLHETASAEQTENEATSPVDDDPATVGDIFIDILKTVREVSSTNMALRKEVTALRWHIDAQAAYYNERHQRLVKGLRESGIWPSGPVAPGIFSPLSTPHFLTPSQLPDNEPTSPPPPESGPSKPTKDIPEASTTTHQATAVKRKAEEVTKSPTDRPASPPKRLLPDVEVDGITAGVQDEDEAGSSASHSKDDPASTVANHTRNARKIAGTGPPPVVELPTRKGRNAAPSKEPEAEDNEEADEDSADEPPPKKRRISKKK
ncbi:hypothetical protein GALMADRAFT_208971 [Galerina marginata CBS 339.88]|uniref:Zn(2)-C6 fungal-type domain-containing protein n=1 Tax=Galerina marginata (strain CBS 339.88) TaxID=685588 RepID=A0A067T968_GALM3|nr:hypothetical protein GALMADRAFT_208971 [Galerina marginata CBS 339.88]